MSTVPFAPAPAGRAGRGSRRRRFAGWRPALRMAWRDALRTKARTLLVVLLIAVPVGVMVFADVVIRTTTLSNRQQELLALGHNADAIVFLGQSGGTPGTTLSVASDVEHADVIDISAGRLKLGDKYRFARIQVADLTDPLLAGAYVVTKGVAPRADDEAVVSANVARTRRVKVGDDIALRVNQQHWRVVGIFEQPAAIRDDSIVVARPPTGEFTNSSSTRSFIKAPTDVLRTLLRKLGPQPFVVSRDPAIVKPYDGGTFRRLTPLLSLYTAGTVGLFVIGIVVSAAFAVAARRRLRSLGLAAANGGSPRHLRIAVTAQGVVAGVLGTALGFLLGAISVAIFAPRLSRFSDYRLPSIRIAPVDLTIIAAMALATATVAALVPAISMARVPVGAALAGRRPLHPASGRTPIIGLGLFVGGLVVLGASVARIRTPLGSWFRYAISGGAMLLGSVLCTPWLIGRLEPLATRLRGSSRLAARSMARSRARTGPITAAILAAAGATMALASFDESTAAVYSAAYQSAGQTADVVALTSVAYEAATDNTGPPAVDQSAVRRAAEVLLGAKVSRYDQLTDSQTINPGFVAVPVPGSDAARFVGPQGFATFVTMSPDALRALDVSDSAIAAYQRGTILVMGPGVVRAGALTVQSFISRASDGVAPAVPATTPAVLTPSAVSTPTTRSLPAIEIDEHLLFGIYGGEFCDQNGCRGATGPPPIVVPPALIAELGKRPSQSVVRFELPKPISRAQQDELRGLQSDIGVALDAKAEAGEDVAFTTVAFADRYRPNRMVQAILLGVVTAAALAVTAIGLALSAAEGRDEEATLLSLGAPPRLRRSRRAWEALFTSGIACVLAVPLGFLPAAVVIANRYRDDGQTHEPIVFPWRVGLTLGIALPLLAAAVFWLVTRPQRIVLVRED